MWGSKSSSTSSTQPNAPDPPPRLTGRALGGTERPRMTTSARLSLPAAPGPSALETRLAEIHPDDLTPKTALELLYELRGLLRDEGTK